MRTFFGLGDNATSPTFPERGVIDDGAAVGDLDVAPAFERREHHEQVGHRVRGYFVIDAAGRPAHRDRRARFGDELLRRLSRTNHRAIRVAGACKPTARPPSPLQISPLALGGMIPFGRCGWRAVLSRRWIVESLTASTMSASPPSLRRRGSSAHSPRRLRAGQSDQPGLLRRRKCPARRAQPGPCGSDGLEPFSTNGCASDNHGTLVFRASTMRLSLPPSPSCKTSAFNRMRAFQKPLRSALTLRIIASTPSCSALTRTPHRFTEGGFAAITSIARIAID